MKQSLEEVCLLLGASSKERPTWRFVSPDGHMLTICERLQWPSTVTVVRTSTKQTLDCVECSAPFDLCDCKTVFCSCPPLPCHCGECVSFHLTDVWAVCRKCLIASEKWQLALKHGLVVGPSPEATEDCAGSL